MGSSAQLRATVQTSRLIDRSLKEIIDARIWAGLHFRTADLQAQLLGRNVAEYTADNYFQPVGQG
jgi:hypothetical protein